MRPVSRAVRRVEGGFTLIEVIGALLVFSAGVLMMLDLTTSLSQRLEHSALNSLIAAEGQERLDSLGGVPLPQLDPTTKQDTLTLRGIRYNLTQRITRCPCSAGSASPLTRKVEVSLVPVSGTGPSFSAAEYRTDPW